MVKTSDRYWRWAAIAVCVLGPLVAGCIPFVPVPYAYPSVEWTPPVDTKAPNAEVVALRVDALERRGSHIFSPITEEPQFTLIPLSQNGIVPVQATAGVSRGFIWNCIALIHTGNVHRTVLVRLYRAGYQTVEIRPSLLCDELDWKPAATPLEREEAIDHLHYYSYRDDPDGWDPDSPTRMGFLNIPPGSTATEHRQALLFIAGEYEKLASEAGVEPEGRTRLLKKAGNLKDLAAK